MSACALTVLAELATESGAHSSCAEGEGNGPTAGGAPAGRLGGRTRLRAGCLPTPVLVDFQVATRVAVEPACVGEGSRATGASSVDRLALTRSLC